MSTLSKSAQALKYICERRPGVRITKLQKLAYLADLESRKVLGHPVTAFEYIWYEHGPFDNRLYNAIDELKSAGYVLEETNDLAPGYRERLVRDQGVSCELDLTAAELEILDYVVDAYGNKPLQTLMEEVVYKTEPTRVAERGRPLAMHAVDNVERKRIGLDLDDVIAQEKEVLKGNFEYAPDFFDALQAEAVAARSPRHR